MANDPLATVSGWHFLDRPAFSTWLLVLLFAAAVAAIVYLYIAQRRVASRRTVAALTAIRIALLALLLVLLMAPVVQWTTRRSSAGTLWLLLDHSKSMELKDPQASDVERLRWAQALGYLPAKYNSQTAWKVRKALATISLVKQRLPRLHQAMRDDLGGVSTAQNRAQVKRFMAKLMAWSHRLHQAVRQLAADNTVKTSGAAALASVRRALAILRQGIGAAQARVTIRGVMHSIAWIGVRANLDEATATLPAIARGIDAKFLAAHHGPAVRGAIARVRQMSRGQLAYASLVQGASGKLLLHLMHRSNMKIASFGRHVQGHGNVAPGTLRPQLKGALYPTGKATDIAAGLRYIAGRIAPHEPASVLLISDGRQNVGGDATAPARLLAARGVRVFTLCVGSHRNAPDAAVRQIHAPNWIYRTDRLRATAVLRLDGLKGQTVHVDLYRGKKKLAQRQVFVPKKKMLRRITFRDRPGTIGVFDYSIRIKPLAVETNTQNNIRHFRVAVKKEKLQVLLADNQPDWEYQYLENYLARDKRIHLQSVLLHPAKVQGVRQPPGRRASPHNPSFLAQALPNTNKRWSQFDVIILGDVAPEDLPPAQQQFLANAVRNRGSALICIAGRHNMPFRYADSPLSQLLPVRLSSDWSPAKLARQYATGFRPALAPEGANSVLGQFSGRTDQNARLWSHVPLWYWHSEQTSAKASARVLWEIASRTGKVRGNGGSLAAARHNALLATMSVGLGKVLYLAADQTWRLRYVAGDNVMNRFWGQVLRWAVGNDLPAGGKFVRFGTDKSHYTQGQPVMVRARVLGPNFSPLAHLHFQAIAQTSGGAGNAGRPPQVVGSVTLRPERSAPGYYQGTLTGLPPGVLGVSLRGNPVRQLLHNDPTATEKFLRISIRPQKNLELRDTDTDPKAMERIAFAGNGFMLNGPQAALLARHIPKKKQVLVQRRQAGFFANPHNPGTTDAHVAFLLLFTALIAAEWVIRKRAGLV